MNWSDLNPKKKRLDSLRPFKADLSRNLDEWFRVELTYTSNALEGNTLTRQETAVVLEKGIAVGGRTLREHLEASNHAKALDWVKEAVSGSLQVVGEKEILTLHGIILNGIDDANAGRYRTMPVRIAGSTVIFPNPLKVPQLMAELAAWLKSPPALHPAELAAQAHYRLVTIHPFIDGNGRTARLLMNLLLAQSGYPPTFIRLRERVAYLNGLEKAQLGGNLDDYEKLMFKAVDRSFDIYLNAAEGKTPVEEEKPVSVLLKIGTLAKKTGESVATLRHWTKEGLLEPEGHTAGGYVLYSPETVERVKVIRELQGKRLTLGKIKTELKNRIS